MNKNLMNMMKPLPITGTKNGLKAQREVAVMEFLSRQNQSVCSGDVAENIGAFPGCDEPRECDYRYYSRMSYAKRRAIVSTLKRLESQGRILSILFSNRRYYSIPVETEGGEQ